MAWLTLSACSGIVKHTEDTFWPFDNPNAPKGESENMRRVRGASVVARPIVTEEGDIWPGQPDPVPTLQDVSNPSSHFNEAFHRSLKTLNDDLRKQPFEDGESLSIGEEVSARNGVTRRSSAIGSPLPSDVEDNAPAYLQGPNHDTVAIPNGDGTTTMVAPDGSVTIVRGTPDTVQKAVAADKTVESKSLPPVGGKESVSPPVESPVVAVPPPVRTRKESVKKVRSSHVVKKKHRTQSTRGRKAASRNISHHRKKAISHRNSSKKGAVRKHTARKHHRRH
ncbi:hypothetical protein PT277_04255 [Acetobacteraceae bacterium ESL0709]|nr:hypothetical protein [Acetobacteraceae bacterium ESL0697]MDF7677910.1 hypothetical protein [Acetobacteraceae bacterium ESL0709]